MRRRYLGLLAAALWPYLAFGYKEVPPPEKVVLPPALGPAASLAAVRVPAGFTVELVAAEPLVMDPVDLAWGADGRLWVVEMADYPKGLDGRGQPGGRIRFLESTRGDGRYDRSTLFADGLKSPTAVRPWRDGVIVVSVPNILFLRDTDGDGRADETTVLYRGLAEGNEQHLANGLVWSLDGWLHLADGDSGGKVQSLKTGKTVDLGRRDFRIHPESGDIEVLTGMSQYGRTRDDWGNWFGGNNSNPLWHYAIEEHYLRRNPHLVPPNAFVTVGKVAGAARIYPASRTLARFNDPHGFNHFTSACGIAIYRDDFLGPEFAGNAFICEPVHNLVHRQIVRPAGTTFASERAPGEQESEFFASADNWSRFVAARTGPDGALYIADMYRLVIEHPTWIPAAWQKELGDLRAGADKGRIYRVRPADRAPRPVPRLDRADAAALVAALESPSGELRDLAQQQLAWRRPSGAEALLRTQAAQAARAATRAQALWSLRTMDALTAADVRTALRDGDAAVRRQAVRLAEDFAAAEPALAEAVIALAGDAEKAVRLQVAFSLGAWRETARVGATLAKLVGENSDGFIRAAAFSSALPQAEAMLAALQAAPGVPTALLVEAAAVTENSRALAGLLENVAARRTAADLPAAFGSLGQLLDWLQRNQKSLAQLQRLADAPLQRALGATDLLFAEARRVAGDPAEPVALRTAAVRVLGRDRSRQAEDFAQLAGLLGPAAPEELRLATVAALGKINRSEVPELLLKGWSGYGRATRAAVVEAATSRPAWTQAFLAAAEADPVLASQVEAGVRQRLMYHIDARIADRAVKIFASGQDRNRQALIDRMLAAVTGRAGDRAKGAAVFAQSCQSCHSFGRAGGGALGPDLAVVKDRSAPYLVTHIFDPNRAVEDRYLMRAATLQDGRSLAGMLVGESTNSLVLRGLDGTEHTILRQDLKLFVSSERSLMPEGLEAALDETAMADLIAYLGGNP
ncbi:MAG: hypothetical protein B9S34_03855 [Opitutia bacterium Tous-C1TDCM]|nr:MAG: hypothetical protein B9S34_03855 [Opitutae bacterium Tous-C1TDCM]